MKAVLIDCCDFDRKGRGKKKSFFNAILASMLETRFDNFVTTNFISIGRNGTNNKKKERKKERMHNR